MSPHLDATMTADEAVEYYGTREMRWYQVAARNATAQALAQGAMRILIELPTGAGKTLTIAASLSYPEIRAALGVENDRPLRVLFCAHKHRLLTQAEETFAEESNVDLVLQSIFSDIPEEVVAAGWDVTVMDECHHESCASMQYQLEKIGEKPLIGLTATKDRADGHLIKFDHIIAPISREEAVTQGYLAETDLHSFIDVPSPDKIQILTDIFTDFGHEMGQTMVFVRTKREVVAITQVLTDLGYAAVGVLNQTERELDRILNAFSSKEYQFIVNCNKINEGVDVKGCSDVVLGRQVGSYPMLNQIVGRAARPDSDCNVWELINPLSGRNLDTTVVVGTPRSHRLVHKKNGQWKQDTMNYTFHRSNKQLGIVASRFQ